MQTLFESNSINSLPIKDSRCRNVLFICHDFPPCTGVVALQTLRYVQHLEDFGWKPYVLAAGESSGGSWDSSLCKRIPKNVEVFRVRDNPVLSMPGMRRLVAAFPPDPHWGWLLRAYSQARKILEHSSMIFSRTLKRHIPFRRGKALGCRQDFFPPSSPRATAIFQQNSDCIRKAG